MPKTWKEAIFAACIIIFTATVLSFALLQTEQTNMAETLRTSGFVDESPPMEENAALTEATSPKESSNLIGIIGITIRQTLQIIVPLLITLRVLKTTRLRSKRKRHAVA